MEKLSLRDRRRLQTGRDIRMATLRLCLREGYEAVTTEMISAELGISPRTFFNYFANKEAALFGPQDELDAEVMAQFRRGSGALVEDFICLLECHFRAAPPERELLLGVHELRKTWPQLELGFLRMMSKVQAQMADAIAARLGPGSEARADLLAASLIHAVTIAMARWAAQPGASVGDLLADLRGLLTGLADGLRP